MWTQRISSGTPKYPTPHHIYRDLLARLIERHVDSSWAHFEVVADGGWFKNLLHGKQPWVEVAFLNRETFQLNLGIPTTLQTELPIIPTGWKQQGKGLWNAPATELEELIDWMDRCLATASATKDYRVSGWIEGL